MLAPLMAREAFSRASAAHAGRGVKGRSEAATTRRCRALKLTSHDEGTESAFNQRRAGCDACGQPRLHLRLHPGDASGG